MQTTTDKRYTWNCTCGRFGISITREAEARQQAAEHERYCIADGQTQLREVDA